MAAFKEGGESAEPGTDPVMETAATTGPAAPRRFRSLPVQNFAGVRVPVADGFRARLLGLSWLEREAAGPGLLIPNCRSVHTFGMRFPLDIYFLGDDDQVLRSCPDTAAGRFVSCRGATDVLELVSREAGGESGRSGS